LITSLEKLVRIFPRSVDLRYNLGAVHLRTGNYGEAVRAFQKALVMAPDNTGIGSALARAFMAAGSPAL
jgi:cytochrome c-type biogenesis protein CcmH/NrfG